MTDTKEDGVHAHNGQFAVWIKGKLVSVHETRKEANLALPAVPTKTGQGNNLVRVNGIHQYGKAGYWHVIFDGQYYGNFAKKLKAQERYVEVSGEDLLIDATDEDSVAANAGQHGVYKNTDTGHWHVYYKKMYVAHYLYESSARARFTRMCKTGR